MRRFAILWIVYATIFSFILGGVFSWAVFSSQQVQERQQQQYSAQEDNSKHVESEFGKFWRKTTDDPVAYFTFCLVILTAVLSFASIFQGLMLVRADKTARIAAEAANDSAEVARNTLIATERPWIQVKDIKIIGPLEFANGQARVDLEFTLKNVGNSPAIRTELQIKLTISNTIDLRIEQKDFADLIIASRDYAKANPSIVQTEFGFFPGQEIKFFRTAWMGRTELTRFREWAGKTPGAIIHPAVVGGVFYEFPFEKGHHQTGIIFGLQKLTPYQTAQRPSYSVLPDHMPIQDIFGAIHLEGSIPKDDLVFVQFLVGTGPIT